MLKITKNQGSIQVTADKSGFYPFDGTITFPTNSLFTATSANTDMITFKSTSNGDVQFVGNYKDITISGRSYDTKQKFLTAFSNLANQGSVDAYTKAETDAKLDAKQGKLKAGNGITLTEDATDNTTVVKTAVSLTDNGNGAYQVGDSIEIDPYDTVRIGGNTTSGSGTRGSVMMGNAASITGICNVAIGYDAAGNNSGTAVGYSTRTVGDKATAIGYQAKAIAVNGVAIGSDADASVDNPLVINAGYKTVDDIKQPLTVLQSDTTGKLSVLKGDGTDERMVIQDEIEALKNTGGSGGTVDAYTKAETDAKIDAKQDKLTAGSGITITKDETAGTSTIATAVSLTDNGNGAYTVGDSIKIGSKAIALGSNANINKGNNSVVIGNDTTTNYGCVTIGYNATATKSFCTAIGNYAISHGSYGIAVGSGTSIGWNGYWCIAIGKQAQADDYSTVSIGYNAQANKDKPLVINAGSKTDDGKNPSFTVLQSDSTGKISILKGDGSDERMVISDEITALKAEITTLKAEIAALKGGASTGA